MAAASLLATEEVFYWSELTGVRVFDLKGRFIGNVRDAAVVPLIDPIRVDRFLVGAGATWLSIRYDQVKSISLDGIHLKDERLTPYHSDEYMLRMRRDLLDQQIIDAQGRKLVRVNDVTFLIRYENDSDVLHLLEVDIGVRSIVRRLLQGVMPPSSIRRIQSRIPTNSIRWEFCNILEADPQRRVRLNISNKLLEKMHPADLADIVERLGHEDRAAIFDNLDSEAAAELLTEVDPDLQAHIIEALKAKRAAAILEEMEASEAAHLLTELEGERSEEILEEMQPEEKEEVEELREFRDDTAGGVMDTGYLALPEDAIVADAITELRAEPDRIEWLHVLFLVDAEHQLKASIPVSRLFFAEADKPLKELASDPLLCVRSHERVDRISEMFDKYNLALLRGD